jgi:hypothetical protein
LTNRNVARCVVEQGCPDGGGGEGKGALKGEKSAREDRGLVRHHIDRVIAKVEPTFLTVGVENLVE